MDIDSLVVRVSIIICIDQSYKSFPEKLKTSHWVFVMPQFLLGLGILQVQGCEKSPSVMILQVSPWNSL
jgi:hypothetical protein